MSGHLSSEQVLQESAADQFAVGPTSAHTITQCNRHKLVVSNKLTSQ